MGNSPKRNPKWPITKERYLALQVITEMQITVKMKYIFISLYCKEIISLTIPSVRMWTDRNACSGSM